MDKGLLTLSETAEMIGLGETSTKTLIRKGELPKVKIGKSMRVPRTSVEKWIADRTREAEAQLNGLVAAQGRLEGYDVPDRLEPRDARVARTNRAQPPAVRR